MLDIELLEAKEYNVLFDKYKGYIYKFVSKFSNVDSTEVISSCNIAFAKAIKKFKKSNCKFSTFLYTCMQNEILCYIKKLHDTEYAYSLDAEIQVDGGSFLNLFSSNYNVEEKCINKILVRKLLKHLDFNKKVVLIAKMQGYNNKEIAKYLNVSVRYICKLQAKAIRELQNMLNIEQNNMYAGNKYSI